MLAVVALASVSACADLLDIAENPVLVPPDPWQCAASEPMMAAMAAAPPPEKAIVRVRVCNFISTNCSEPVRGVSASLCDKRDVKCSNPRQMNLTDVDGTLQFEVPTGGVLGAGFDGYLLITPKPESCVNAPVFGRRPEACLFAPFCDQSMPDSPECQVPAFIAGAVFFNPPVTQDIADPIVVPMFPTLKGLDFVMAAGALGTDPNLGIVFARALDCDGRPAPGLTFNISAGAPPLAVVYQSEGVISTGAKETDTSGLGGLLGINAGFATVSAYAESMMGPREVASIGTQILPQTVTYVTLRPNAPDGN